MKIRSIIAILSVIAAALFAVGALVTFMDQAHASKRSGQRMMAVEPKAGAGVREQRRDLGKLQCIGTGCPRMGEKAPTTGTYKRSPQSTFSNEN